jgi:hypothetical protein
MYAMKMLRKKNVVERKQVRGVQPNVCDEEKNVVERKQVRRDTHC